jgi:cytoskeletal protein CcmA (bactofilin family)
MYLELAVVPGRRLACGSNRLISPESPLPCQREVCGLREEAGKVEGDLTLGDDLILRGMVTGDVSVPRGRRLELFGMICGDVKLEPGASAAVRGMVLGSVINGGDLDVWGTIEGTVEDAGGRSTLHPGAVVHGALSR